MRLDRAADVIGKGLAVLGLVVALLSLFRLDGTGVGLGLMLGLYGLLVGLLGAIYRELVGIRQHLEDRDAPFSR